MRSGAWPNATAAAAVQLELNDDNTIKEAGIGITAVSHVSLRVTEGEALLRGQRVTRDLVKAVAEKTSAVADPISDGRGSADYKKQVVGVLVARGIMQSMERLGLAVEA